MLYIEKGPCPEEVQQKITQLKARPSWASIPCNLGALPEHERHRWANKLRKNFFDELPKKNDSGRVVEGTARFVCILYASY